MSNSCKRTLPKHTVTFTFDTRRKEWKKGKEKSKCNTREGSGGGSEWQNAPSWDEKSSLQPMARLHGRCGEAQEYQSLHLAIRKAVSQDQEAWSNAVIEEIKESLKRCWQDFLRKLRVHNASRVKPLSTILDESGDPIQTSRERLPWWKMHFKGVLNVPASTVAVEVIAHVVDQVMSDTTEVTGEEVEMVMRKMKNGKAPGSDQILWNWKKKEGRLWLTCCGSCWEKCGE